MRRKVFNWYTGVGMGLASTFLHQTRTDPEKFGNPSAATRWAGATLITVAWPFIIAYGAVESALEDNIGKATRNIAR